MINATIKKRAFFSLSVFFALAFTLNVNAQKTDLGEKFIFFVNGANIEVPTLDGTVVNDPLDETEANKVFRLDYGVWAEKGFRFNNGEPTENGGDLSGIVGDSYGESDTLYFSFLSSSVNQFNDGFVSLFDTDTGGDRGTHDMRMRLRWKPPVWAFDSTWHHIALPLPPRTLAGLDSAKAGVDINGDSLTVEVDSLFSLWGYDGAWSNQGQINGSYEDEFFQDFDWPSIQYLGYHFNWNGPGAPVYFDNVSIGVNPFDEENPIDAPAPGAVSDLNIVNNGGLITVSWDEVSGAAAYNVYTSDKAIDIYSNLSPDKVILAGETLSINQAFQAPHRFFSEGLGAFFSVTAKSALGTQGEQADGQAEGEVKIDPYFAVELDPDDVLTIEDALFDGLVPSNEDMVSFFPEGFLPVEINQSNYKLEVGEAPESDEDLSGKFWTGYDAELDYLIVYAEIKDEFLSLAPETGDRDGGGNAAWAWDTWEITFGGYEPASFITGSDHTSMERGDEPDYQFRAGAFANGADPFIQVGFRYNTNIPNSQTTIDTTEAGLIRMLTLIDTFSLSTGIATQPETDAVIDFPDSDGVKVFPINFAINDADMLGAGPRETQISWSSLSFEDGQFYQDPRQWKPMAFVGLNQVEIIEVSNEIEVGSKPFAFDLEQNYPNPFNPSTNIQFTLASSSDVTLEVFNMLGQKVATLLQNEKLTAGKHSEAFNASSLSSGMYVYRLSTTSFVQSRKMMLIK